MSWRKNGPFRRITQPCKHRIHMVSPTRKKYIFRASSHEVTQQEQGVQIPGCGWAQLRDLYPRFAVRVSQTGWELLPGIDNFPRYVNNLEVLAEKYIPVGHSSDGAVEKWFVDDEYSKFASLLKMACGWMPFKGFLWIDNPFMFVGFGPGMAFARWEGGGNVNELALACAYVSLYCGKRLLRIRVLDQLETLHGDRK